MVQKNDNHIFLVKITRENGELEEFFLNSPDADTALFNLEKSYNRKFRVIQEGLDIPVLEEDK